jgi:hypothetical protein
MLILVINILKSEKSSKFNDRPICELINNATVKREKLLKEVKHILVLQKILLVYSYIICQNCPKLFQKNQMAVQHQSLSSFLGFFGGERAEQERRWMFVFPFRKKMFNFFQMIYSCMILLIILI